MKTSKRKCELSWQNPKLCLKHIRAYEGRNRGLDRGFGVFSKASIKKGDTLSVFGGYVIAIKNVKKLPEQLQEYCYQVHDDFLYGPVTNSQVSPNEGYNHSCNPNAGFKDSLTLIALRDIQKGEEVAFDYGTCLTTHLFDFKCDCGSKNCRIHITGDDWKLSGLQRKYGNYFQPYILEKIKNLKKKKQ